MGNVAFCCVVRLFCICSIAIRILAVGGNCVKVKRGAKAKFISHFPLGINKMTTQFSRPWVFTFHFLMSITAHFEALNK